MDDRAERDDLLNELVLRVAALEDTVAFLEVWCEEQQDALDRVGETATYWFFEDREPEPVRLRIVDLRDRVEDDESEHQRRIERLRERASARSGPARWPSRRSCRTAEAAPAQREASRS